MQPSLLNNTRLNEFKAAEIGQLSGVIKESLEFAFEETLKTTVLENATIIISETKGIARCNNCGTEFENPD